MFLTALYFIIALFVLISVHELGHFIIARACGVKVLCFSLGFGKKLWSFFDRHGTEFSLSLIPLGGYVKMLDETEGPVDPEELSHAFNRQGLWKRFLIVLAGPVFNLFFAIFALWLVGVIGVASLAPIVEQVTPKSIAASAGLLPRDQIYRIDGTDIHNWQDFQYAILPNMGSNKVVQISVISKSDKQSRELSLPLQGWVLQGQKPDLLKSLGIHPFVPHIPAIVGEIMPGSPAEKAGLQVGDVLSEMNHQPLLDWIDLVNFVREHPHEWITIKANRQNQSFLIKMQIASMEGQEAIGFIGLRSKQVNWPKDWFMVIKAPPLKALQLAFSQTLHLTRTTFVLMGRLFTGKLDLKTMSGPIGIAQGAGESGRHGFVYYLSFLAMVSISLAVLNLLPIPMLDGGHLFFYGIEFMIRRPVPERLRLAGMYIGLFLLISLMTISLTNDLTRLSSG